MSTNKNIITKPTAEETRAGLNSRLSALIQKGRELIEAQEVIALEAAEGDADAPNRLAANYTEFGKISSERKAIEAALRALGRREHREDMHASLDGIEADRAEALACIEAVRPAFDRVVSAVDRLEQALGDLGDVQAAARRTEMRLRGVTHNDRATDGAASVFSTSTSIDAMRVVHVRLEKIGSRGQPMAAMPMDWLEKQIARAQQAIDDGLRRREQYAREQLEGPDQAA